MPDVTLRFVGQPTREPAIYAAHQAALRSAQSLALRKLLLAWEEYRQSFAEFECRSIASNAIVLQSWAHVGASLSNLTVRRPCGLDARSISTNVGCQLFAHGVDVAGLKGGRDASDALLRSFPALEKSRG